MSKTDMADYSTSIQASDLAGFFANYNSAEQKIEQSLLMLELSPEDDLMLRDMQQSVDSIHQALSDISLMQLQPLTRSLNRLLQSIRNQHIPFETVLSDLLLLAVDDIKMIIEKMIDGESQRCVLMSRLPRICDAIDAISDGDEFNRDLLIKDALLLLDPSMEIIENSISNSDALANLFSKDIPDEEELAAYGVEESDDFIFFRALAEPLEQRANYWRGRVHRMLRLALKMNDAAGRPVEPNQLAAAIYMHDAGMALLPLDIINGQGELSEEQRQQIKQHPVIGYELMRYMKNWRDAATMVLQHHERVDGQGYPYGLTDDEICDGAKIIAIVDLVDARTHERAHATLLKRPLLRAAIEIGKHEGGQFSERWVAVFKQVFNELRELKKYGHHTKVH
jgi:HD-GYP domain-containing protein (c-di-GMP phosphodiesterase class II)